MRVDVISNGSRKEKELLLSELIAMDRVSADEAWYADSEELYYYIRTQRDDSNCGVVLYSGIPKSKWEELIRRVWV